MIKEIIGLLVNKSKGGTKMMYDNVQCVEDYNIFNGHNVLSYFRIAYQKYKLKIYAKIKTKNYELENKLIKDLNDLNEMSFCALSEIIKDFDEIINDLEADKTKQELYIMGLSDVESKLDSYQYYLIKVKSLIDRQYFSYNKKSKIDTITHMLNRNLNLIIEIREKIDRIDDITSSNRFYYEINKKYKNASIILLSVTLLNIFLGLAKISFYPWYIALLVGLLSFLGFVLFSISKSVTNKIYFYDKNEIL